MRAYNWRWRVAVAGFLRTRRRGDLRLFGAAVATGAAARLRLRRAGAGARRRRLAAIILRVAAFCAAERRARAMGFLPDLAVVLRALPTPLRGRGGRVLARRDSALLRRGLTSNNRCAIATSQTRKYRPRCRVRSFCNRHLREAIGDHR